MRSSAWLGVCLLIVACSGSSLMTDGGADGGGSGGEAGGSGGAKGSGGPPRGGAWATGRKPGAPPGKKVDASPWPPSPTDGKFDRPSEHSRKHPPACTEIPVRSGSTAGSNPTDRVMMLRKRDSFASSGDSRPAR